MAFSKIVRAAAAAQALGQERYQIASRRGDASGRRAQVLPPGMHCSVRPPPEIGAESGFAAGRRPGAGNVRGICAFIEILLTCQL
jgi:hypothetical protein